MRRHTLAALVALALAPPGSALATGGGEALLYGGAGQGKVIFDGRLHASKGFVCDDCHTRPQLFATHKQALITMDAHASDRSCFHCHDGSKAFDACTGCHRK